ncbi:hypothetical protein D9M68_805820 [compost metagenome]
MPRVQQQAPAGGRHQPVAGVVHGQGDGAAQLAGALDRIRQAGRFRHAAAPGAVRQVPQPQQLRHGRLQAGEQAFGRGGMGQGGQRGQDGFVLHRLLAQHALRHAGALKEAVVLIQGFLAGDPGGAQAEQDQPAEEGARAR